jgi:hypothetical protein
VETRHDQLGKLEVTPAQPATLCRSDDKALSGSFNHLAGCALTGVAFDQQDQEKLAN